MLTFPFHLDIKEPHSFCSHYNTYILIEYTSKKYQKNLKFLPQNIDFKCLKKNWGIVMCVCIGITRAWFSSSLIYWELCSMQKYFGSLCEEWVNASILVPPHIYLSLSHSLVFSFHFQKAFHLTNARKLERNRQKKAHTTKWKKAGLGVGNDEQCRL